LFEALAFFILLSWLLVFNKDCDGGKVFPTLLPFFQGDRFSWLVPYSAFSIPASLPWFGSKVERNFAPSPLIWQFSHFVLHSFY